MPSIPLVTELGSKADTFQALLNTSSVPQSVSKTLLPIIPAEELFTNADSRIFVRSRPVIAFDQQPMGDASIVQKIEGFRDAVLMAPKVSVSGQCSVEPTRVTLDGIFVGSSDSTEKVYDEACAPLLSLSAGGASTCVLCYGQTGSGKTYTTSGLMKLFSADVGPYLATHTITVGVVEIQSQANMDLISSKPVQIVEDPSGEIQVLGGTEYSVETSEQMEQLIGLAAAQRSTKSTGRNEASSRSHMIVRIRFVPKAASWAKPGFLFVADLAGSENTADSSTHDKVRQMEAKFINSSLMTLKDCIRARALSGSSDKHLHIPFRQSPLTLMLRDCFELAVRRPTKTVVIACVSPLLRDARHTSNTLRYASLLAVAPPSVVVALSADDPNGWSREQALEFLTKASRGRLTQPELVLPEGDGRALVHIPEADFIIRVTTTHPNIGEKTAKMIYTEVWKAVVDARTKTRQALKAPSSKVAPQKKIELPPMVFDDNNSQRNVMPSSTDHVKRTSGAVATSGRISPAVRPHPVPSVSNVHPSARALPSKQHAVVMGHDAGKENIVRVKRPSHMTEAQWRAERESGWVVE